MLALTGDIWSTLRIPLSEARPICFKEAPQLYPVAHWIWKLYRHRAKLESYGVIHSTPGFHHLPMALLFLGFTGRTLCACRFCQSLNYESFDGNNLL